MSRDSCSEISKRFIFPCVIERWASGPPAEGDVSSHNEAWARRCPIAPDNGSGTLKYDRCCYCRGINHFLKASAIIMSTGNISRRPNHISRMSVIFCGTGIKALVNPTLNPTLPSALATSNRESARL